MILAPITGALKNRHMILGNSSGPQPVGALCRGAAVASVAALARNVPDGAIVVITGASSRALDMNSTEFERASGWLSKISRATSLFENPFRAWSGLPIRRSYFTENDVLNYNPNVGR